MNEVKDSLISDYRNKHEDSIGYTAYIDEDGNLSLDPISDTYVSFLSLEPDYDGEWWYVDMETGQTREEWIAGCLEKDASELEEDFRKEYGYDDEDDVDPDDFVQWVMKDDDIADIIDKRLHELVSDVIIDSGWMDTIKDTLRESLKEIGWEC